MAETIRRVDYFYVTAPNKPGEGVRGSPAASAFIQARQSSQERYTPP